jgi:hypothetical protein
MAQVGLSLLLLVQVAKLVGLLCCEVARAIKKLVVM